MNILFVLYGDFSSNSANPLVLYARELHSLGHSCAVAVPSKLETVHQHANLSFRPMRYGDVLAEPESVFPDGRPADIIHAWTPRETVRRFVTSYMARRPTPLLIYLEDNELWISCRDLGFEGEMLFQQPERYISERLPDALSHPFQYDSFIGLADAAVVIQDKLNIEVPPWVHCETVMPGVDLEFFSPRAADPLLRKQYGVAGNEKVIVYHGGMNGFTKPAMETLCRAVGLINRQGHSCRLLRAGPFALDFIDQLPLDAAAAISDLGLLPRGELPNLLALADVFVQPGKIDPFEDLRLPGKLPEFLAMGCPVILPDVNIAHLFRDGLDAVIMRTGSAEEIAAKCIGLFSDPQQASMIGRAGRQFAEKYFDLRSQARRLEDVYKIACNNFNLAIASEIWRVEDENIPIALMLAHKLSLLADLHSTKYGFKAGEMLREHARYIELMQHRVQALDAGVVKRDGQIVSLNQAVDERDGRIVSLNQAVDERDGQIASLKEVVANRDGQIVNFNQAVAERDNVIEEILASTSWRITRPLRAIKSISFIAHMIKMAHVIRVVLPRMLQRSGGIRVTISKVRNLHRREGWGGVKRMMTALYAQTTHSAEQLSGFDRNDYPEWIRRYDTLTDEGRATMRVRIGAFASKPLISIVMPVYNPNPKWLIEAIESVRKQIYPHWELCIADDASSNKSIHAILERYAKEDSRIKVVYRDQNGHICAASNSAMELAAGEWVALLDHDDALTEHALFWVADAINRDRDIRLIYSDEDKIDSIGRRFEPYFKCDWNVDLFYSHNMVTHLGVYHAALLGEIGGFREGLEGAQDYDLALRCIERIEPNQIHHIPRVLYHWRIHAESTAQSGDAKPYARLAGKRALTEHLQRQGVNGSVSLLDFGMYRVNYTLPDRQPMVSLIIPTRNGLNLIRQCIESILSKTTYQNYEILIVDNGSDDPATLQYFKSLESEPKIRALRDDRPFNFSAINNAAVKVVHGELVGLVNNDIEVISPNWLSEMVSHAWRPGIGAVGARLWYPDKTLQHGGVILGVGGVAGHSHKHLDSSEYGYFGRANLVQSFSAVTAACLVIRRAIYEEVGGLNETHLPVAFNDIDFCLRVRKAGYRNVWIPDAELYHHESATRGCEDNPEKQARFTKEVQYMKRYWGDLLLNDPAYSPNLTLDHEDFSLAWPPRVRLLDSSPRENLSIDSTRSSRQGIDYG